jgi:hypothetical protein
VTEIAREIDGCHSPAAELAFDDVAALKSIVEDGRWEHRRMTWRGEGKCADRHGRREDGGSRGVLSDAVGG